jgi:hypothetical protein
VILSIKDNWDDAKAQHGDYVRGRFKAALEHHASRASVGTQIGKFLKTITPKKGQNLKALLRAIPPYIIALDAFADNTARVEFRRQLGLSPIGKGTVVPGPEAKAYLRGIEKLDFAVLKRILKEFERQRSACGDVTHQAAYYRHIKEDLIDCRVNSKKYATQCFIPYVADFTAMIAMDTHTVNFLKVIGEDIGIHEFPELKSTISVFEGYYGKCGTAAERKIFSRNIESIFDYDEFIVKKDSWDAFELCDLSRTRTCPYCNQAYAFTVVRKGGKAFKPTLDHFLPKKQFPHLAISLNNLVPSCYACNSNLKHEVDFHAIEHLHPLYDDEHIGFRLEMQGYLDPSNPDGHDKLDFLDLVSDFENAKSKAKLKIQFDSKITKAANSASTFLIEERYARNLKEALSFVYLHIRSAEAVDAELGEVLPGLTESQVLRFDPLNHRDSLLGKMYLELHKQFAR